MISLLMRGFFKMATQIKNLEKEYLLKVLFDKQIPIKHIKDRTEYLYYLEKQVKNEMVLRSKYLTDKPQIKSELDFTFDYQGKAVAFTVKVIRVKEQEITCTIPDALYKDLDRSFSRVGIPKDIQVQFTHLDDRYDLSFPRLITYESNFEEFLENIDPKNLSGLVKQMAGWIKKHAGNYKLVLFRKNKPSKMEECAIAETGKILFLPSTEGSFPETDPFPRKQIITEDIFKIYLEKTGVREALIDKIYARFIKDKADSGIFSDAWVPIIFHEYVIGYIHIWIDSKEKPPLDFKVIDTMYRFAKVLAYSLQIHGYFEDGKIKNEAFKGNVIDISASGLLFAYPFSKFASTLLPDSYLSVKITAGQRSISAKVKIIRRLKDSTFNYFGCRFEDMPEEDFHFLFELIYGKPFTDTDKKFFAEQM